MTTQNDLYNRQYALIARRIGKSHAFYRLSGPLTPIGTAYIQQPAAFTQDYQFAKPNKYGVSTWFGFFDSTQCKVGDVIDGDFGKFFIAALQNCLPILCVQCNRTVSVLRVIQSDSVGVIGYGGDSSDVESALMSGWSASILQGTKGEANDAKIPGDVRTPWWAILMPAFSGIILRTSDIITDDIGRRYIISSAELTDMGWRITAMQAQV